MKKLYSVTVRGKEKTWSFNFVGEEEFVNEWRNDGLEIDEIINVIPDFIVWLGLKRPWCFLQDIGIIRMR